MTAFNTHFIVLGDDSDEGLFCGNITIDTCIFTHQELTVARIVKVQNFSRDIQIRNARVGIASDSDSDDDIYISDTAEVTVIGGEIATGSSYPPLRIKQDSTAIKTFLMANYRLRLPRLGTVARDDLLDTTEADVIYHSGKQLLQMYAPGNGWVSLPWVLGIDALNQGSGIAESNLVPVPGTAVYRITILTICTVTEGGGATVTTTVKWKDRQGMQSRTLASVSLGTLGETSQEFAIRTEPDSPAVAITYLTVKTGAGSGQYDYHIRAERIG